MELNYDNIMACMVKFWDVLPSTTPWAKDNLRDVLAPDFTCSRCKPLSEGGMGHTREDWVEHVARHYEEYRAYCNYKPEPLGIWVDERKKVAVCVQREDFMSPVTGEFVKPVDKSRAMLEIYTFTLVDDEVKIKSRILAAPITPSPYDVKQYFTE